MPSLRIIVILVAVVAVQACEQSAPHPQDTSGLSETNKDSSPLQPAPEGRQVPAAEGKLAGADLKCSPSTFSEGDTITLTMATPHADGLSVDHPDGTAFYIVYPTYGEPSLKFSMMPSEDFTAVSSLRIPADIKANPRVYGREHGVERVFTKPGIYVLKVAKLSTDYGPPAAKCILHFRGAAAVSESGSSN